MLLPKLPSLAKLPKNKSFDYSPVYYDERKEDLQKRVESAMSGETGVRFEPGLLRDKWKRNRNSVSPGNYPVTAIRLLIIAVLLTLSAWYLLS